MRPFEKLTLATLTLSLALAAPATAQQCLGLSATTRGYVTYGVEGTDGATGKGSTLGLRFGTGMIQLQHRELEPADLIDEMQTLQTLGAFPVRQALPLCVTGAFAWTGYDDDRINSWGADAEGNLIQRGTAAGPYLRIQAPVGVALGKELTVSSRFAVGGFVNPTLVYEYEKYESFDGGTVSRDGIGLGFTTGLSMSFRRLLLRSTLSSLSSRNYTLNGFNNFPFLSVQMGVKF